MESWGIVFLENHFFPAKLILRRFPNPLFSRGTHEISVRREILSTNTLYILHIYKQPTEYISKRASQQAGGDLLSHRGNAEKNSRLLKGINKSTERYPRLPYYSPLLFPTITNHYILHYNLSPPGMRRKMHSTFFPH